MVETPIQTFYDGPLFDPLGTRAGLQPVSGVPSHGLTPNQTDLRPFTLEHHELHFEMDPELSFFGDCLRVIDQPDEQPLAPGFPPFGWSGRVLLGGHAMTSSRLRGELTVCFEAEAGGRVPFVIRQRTPWVGEDTVLSAPDGYRLPSSGNEVRLVTPVSRGVLEVATGRVYDFHLNCQFDNTAIRALLAHNPALIPPPLLFPGLPHSGHALAWFEISEAGPLRLNIAAQMFLPLGAGTSDAPLRMPASASPSSAQSPFLARNTSLHPFIVLSCQASTPGEWASAKPKTRVPPRAAVGLQQALERNQGRQLTMLCCPKETHFGDDFDVRAEELGGNALAQSPMFGRVEIQLGTIINGFVPLMLRFSRPAVDYEKKFAPLLRLLPPGSSPGLLGLRGEMAFPKQVYEQRNLSLNSDPYKLSIGIIDVTTGRICNMILRKFLFQDLMMSLLLNEPRTPTDSFSYVGAGALELEAGRLLLDLQASLIIPYPSGYKFPLANGGTVVARTGSQLTPFLHIVALDESAFTAEQNRLRRIDFTATQHVRGLRANSVRFKVELRGGAEQGVTAVELILDDAVVKGRGASSRHASYRGGTLITGDFVVDGDDGYFCSYYLTRRDEQTDLQVLSSNEKLDLWFRGAAEFGEQ